MTCAAGLFAVACGPPFAVSPALSLQFDTDPYSGLNRPDSAIAVGPNHVLTAVNFQMQVQNLDGSNPTKTSIGTSFFPGDPTNSIGDPRVIYDAADDRFIMSWLGFRYPNQGTPDSWCDVAVSATNDPRGAWNKYSFHVQRSGMKQMDFDSLGYDNNAIYVTGRVRDAAGSMVVGNRMVIVDKAKALTGAMLTPIYVDDIALPNNAGLAEIIKPVEPLDTAALNGPTFFLTQSGQSQLVLYTLTDPLGAHSFTETTIPITTWAPPSTTAPQEGGPALPDEDAGFVLQKTTQRNGVIWSAQTVSMSGNSGDRAGVAVYKIKAATAKLVNQYAINDPQLSFFMPAVVPDSMGNAAVVFAASNANSFASILYARYEAMTDQFDAPYVVAEGTTHFDGAAWGDYFDAAGDVQSGNQVWLHGELAVNATTWKMQAARVPTEAPPLMCKVHYLPTGLSCGN
jgi:hypothetical protein